MKKFTSICYIIILLTGIFFYSSKDTDKEPDVFSIYQENPPGYHVVPFGNDLTGDGSVEKPWKSIAYALSQIKGGDRLIIHQGNYREEQLKPPSGSQDNPTIIKGADGEDFPLISAGYQTHAELILHRFLIWKGVTTLRCKDWRFRVEGTAISKLARTRTIRVISLLIIAEYPNLSPMIIPPVYTCLLSGPGSK